MRERAAADHRLRNHQCGVGLGPVAALFIEFIMKRPGNSVVEVPPVLDLDKERCGHIEVDDEKVGKAPQLEREIQVYVLLEIEVFDFVKQLLDAEASDPVAPTFEKCHQKGLGDAALDQVDEVNGHVLSLFDSLWWRRRLTASR